MREKERNEKGQTLSIYSRSQAQKLGMYVCRERGPEETQWEGSPYSIALDHFQRLVLVSHKPNQWYNHLYTSGIMDQTELWGRFWVWLYLLNEV